MAKRRDSDDGIVVKIVSVEFEFGFSWLGVLLLFSFIVVSSLDCG